MLPTLSQSQIRQKHPRKSTQRTPKQPIGQFSARRNRHRCQLRFAAHVAQRKHVGHIGRLHRIDHLQTTGWPGNATEDNENNAVCGIRIGRTMRCVGYELGEQCGVLDTNYAVYLILIICSLFDTNSMQFVWCRNGSKQVQCKSEQSHSISHKTINTLWTTYQVPAFFLHTNIGQIKVQIGLASNGPN